MLYCCAKVNFAVILNLSTLCAIKSVVFPILFSSKLVGVLLVKAFEGEAGGRAGQPLQAGHVMVGADVAAARVDQRAGGVPIAKDGAGRNFVVAANAGV